MLGKTIGPYRIEAELGRGGMGVVYRATDTRLGRGVALKVLPEEAVTDNAARARLLHEARTASALNHPHICTVYEVGEDQGVVYIAMEHVEGRPLDSLVGAGGLSVDTLLRYASQVASALAHAHAQGVVHRDLKSSNIVVTSDGRAKVLDFGLATRPQAALDAATRSRLAAAESASPGVTGTLHYLAPEVLRGQPGDARSDLWAFGVVLYEMAAGHLPFRGRTGYEVASAILREMPPALPAHIPAGLRNIVQRSLVKEPEQRYQQAAEMRAALEAAALDAPRAVAVARGGRRPRPAALILGGALLASAGLLGFNVAGWRDRLWGARSEEKIRSVAILPLKSVSPQGGDDPLGMGITDTVITKMSQVGGLTVRPSSAVRKYAMQETDALAAARELRVDAVLDGSVQRSGERLRVNLNLLRASNGASLWSETFNVPTAHIFDVQDQIAHQVTSGLRFKLTAAEEARMTKRYTASPEAHQSFVRGMYNFDKRTLSPERRSSLDAAITMFKKAIELDPDYALARAQLAYCYAWMSLFVEPGPAWLEKARAELDRAAALDPNLAQIHVVRHELLWSSYQGFQLEAAARELRVAQELDPAVGHDQLGVLYAHMGLEEAAFRELRRAVEVDPTSELNISRLIEGFDLLYRPDEAIAMNRQYGELPGPSSYVRLSYLWKGQYEKAQQLEQNWSAGARDPYALSSRALRLALQGDFRSFEARVPVIVERGRQNRGFHHMTYNVACVYALQGKAERAVEWLEKTVAVGMPNYTLFSRDPHLDRIRNAPAFRQFMNQLKPRWEALQREFGS